MSLIRIELQGFKSFRDRTVINFDHGYTCIVGPNGCGKSNVSDAVRWVLGEQSAKQLRGDNMKSVIFSGTSKLPEMGYAEVTLVFDNKDSMFKTTCEEFSITRKVFRSKSENYYYFNHKPCKRRDIIELLRDTGAGKDSLNIIEQGEVSAIIEAKPQDRRQIFDEAAGIANVKEEKRRTQQALEASNTGIMTLETRIHEMDRQLGPLLKQAEEASRYLALQDQLRLLQYNVFIYKHEHADEEKDALYRHIKECDEFIADKEKTIEETKRKITAVGLETEANDARLRESMERKMQLRDARAEASKDQQVHKTKLEAMQLTLTQLQESLAQTQESKTNAQTELEEAQRVLAVKKDEKFGKDVELGVATAGLDAINAELEESEQDLEKNTSLRFANMSRLSEVYASQAKGETEVALLKENLQRTEEELVTMRADCKEKRKIVDEAQAQQDKLNVENEKIEAERKSKAAASNEARFDRRGVESRLQEMEERVRNKEINVQTLRNAIKEKKGYSKAVGFVVNAAQRDANVGRHFAGVVADLYKVQPEYEEAVEVALGAAVNHVVTYTQDDANVLINAVRQAGVGRITCMPLDRIRGEALSFEYRGALREKGVKGIAMELVDFDDRYQEIFKRLLGRIIVVDSFETAKYLDARYAHGLKIVTLDGKLFDPSGTISGGSRKTMEEQQYDQEKKALDSLKLQWESLKKRKAELDEIVLECDNFLTSSRDKKDELVEQYNALQLTIGKNQELLQALEDRVRDAEATKIMLQSRLDKAVQAIAAAKDKGGEIENDSLDNSEMMARAKADKESKKLQREALVEQRNALSVRVAGLANEIAAIERDCKRLKDETAKADALIVGLTTDIENKTKEIEQHIANRPTLVFTEEEGKQIEALDEVIKQCDEAKETLKTRTASLHETLETLNYYLNVSTNDRTATQGKIEKIDAELSQWTQTIAETYGMTYEDIKDAKDPEFDIKKSAGMLSVLRSNIKAIKNLNLGAKEQYDQLKAERDEADSQLTDAINGKKNIEDMLARITEEMNVKFDSAFKQINANFQNTFSDLFGGGSAELSLVEDPDAPDPDEKGVDIHVQLPGKAKLPLSRLSGGERSLTAIAILFAILKLKPMPFVVLDEVESALDEVNCNRFARFLRRYADKSHFVIITHKKPTMEQADVLYGVTMQQPGVSNVVSVNLAEAVKNVMED